jgi:GNAT superfamily N-acetyltransferase
MTLRSAVEADVRVMFGVDAADGLHVVAGPASRILVWRVGALTVVAVDPAVLDRVRASTADVDPFSASALRSIAGEGWEVFGPSVHTYVDASTFRPVSGPAVRCVELDVLEPLVAAADPAEWAEGGFPGEQGSTLYLLEVDGAPVAAGNMTPWRGQPGDVGLYTHPAHRGRGYGRAVASAMTTEWLPRVEVVRYRALETNSASLAVARSLGFEPHSANFVARFTGPGTPR